jgi:glyoxylase-like metal-dependent hydrolase (beta-lactamase superfamily II)
MTARIHHLVTGELESPLGVSLLGSGVTPGLDREDVLPYGYRYDIKRRNGQVTEGVMVPVAAWLIEGRDETILVDTGLGDVDEVSEMQSRYGVDYVAARTPDQDLIAGLRSKGVEPKDVDKIILTHLHFDHVGNNHLFPNARFIVQRDELPQALAPPRFGMFYYAEYNHKTVDILRRTNVIDGDKQIVDDVWVVKIGGHTPGSMVVMVRTELGVVCLASDVMYNYRNLELNWPMGSYWNMQELMRGYDQLHREADLIIPGHDWKTREDFPSGVIG